MTIKNGHFSKKLVLYPLAQPSIEHDLPLWIEEEEEDEVYHTTSHPICTLDVVIGGGKPDEDDLIDQILQKQSPNTMPLDELVKESESIPWTELCLIEPSPTHVKLVEFGPSRTLNINPSLLANQEEKLCKMLREHLDSFSWNYKEMKGVHPLVFTHHIYIKEDANLCENLRGDEPNPQGHSKGRIAKVARCMVHIPHLRQ